MVQVVGGCHGPSVRVAYQGSESRLRAQALLGPARRLRTMARAIEAAASNATAPNTTGKVELPPEPASDTACRSAPSPALL
ncbi:MAG: hypothetical protein AABM29_01385 [Actinomycetota bacterium]